ncbi:GNAT family N-acetyltransferase [Geitlerinema splendidum]|nr:GNAT family N-acetyltransferase [Geitlerinema splendidum]
MFEFHDPGKLLDDRLELILVERYSGDPNLGYVPAYKFKLICQAPEEEVGKIDLRIGNTHDLIMYGGHIAYSVNPEHRGHRFAARACRLLFPLAKQHGLKELWITCNPNNIASRRTCEIAGATLVEIVNLPEYSDMYLEGERQKCRYRVEL